MELRQRSGLDDLRFSDMPRRLPGGYFTENLVFGVRPATTGEQRSPQIGDASATPLNDADANKRINLSRWPSRLVLRLFPAETDPPQILREVVVANRLADQGFPTARVLLHEVNPAVLGRRFLVMEFLEGAALAGGANLASVLAALRSLPRWPRLLAGALADLHRCDVAPIAQELESKSVSVDLERWRSRCRALLDEQPGLAPGAEWILEHEPEPREAAVLCHGDFWPGNVLVTDGVVSGIIDWTVATAAEPALELGFMVMAFDMAPVEAPPALQRTAARFGERVGRRVIERYRDLSPIDCANQPYYEALRTLMELTNVVAHREASMTGTPRDAPRPTWDAIATAMVDYFAQRTGIRLTLPPPADG